MFLQDAVDNTLDVQPAIDLLASLLPKGLISIPDRIARPMDRDDYAQALSAANDYYAKNGPDHLDSVLIYTVLLIVRGLTQEASNIIRKAAPYFERDVTLQVLQAVRLMSDDQSEAALALLEGLLNVSVPERLLGLMGDLFLDLEEEEQCIQCYKRAAQQTLDEPDVPYRLGHLLYDRGEVFDAAAYFEQAARVAVDDPQFWVLSAQAWVQADEYERAIQSLERVLKLEDEDEELWMEYGVLLASTGQLERARHALERASQLDEFSPDAWTQLANVELESGFFEEALRHYQRAIDVQSTFADAHFGSSVAALEMGDVILAEKFARQALALDEEHAEYHFHLGIVLVDRHKHEEALSHFEQALQSEDAPPMYHVIYAVSLVALNRYDEAMTRVERTWLLPMSLEAQGATVVFVEQLLKQQRFDETLTFLGNTEAQGCASWRAINRALYALTHALHGQEADIPQWTYDDFDDEELYGMEWDVYPFLNLVRQVPEAQKREILSMLRAIP